MATSSELERGRYRVKELPGPLAPQREEGSGWLVAINLLILGVEFWFLAIPLVIAMVAVACVGWPVAWVTKRLQAGSRQDESEWVDCTRTDELSR